MYAFEGCGRVFVFRNLHDPACVVGVGEFSVRVAHDDYILFFYLRFFFFFRLLGF